MKNYYFLIFLLLALGDVTFSQNAIVGSGFSSGWTTNSNFKYLASNAGTSYMVTSVANGTGNQYFRMGVDWGGTTGQYTITPGSDTQIYPNTEYSISSTSTSSGAMYFNVTSTSYYYVFKTKDASSSPSFKLIVFLVQGTVQSVSSVSQSPSTVYPGQSSTITATLSGSLSSGQGVYMRYSTDSWSTSSIVSMSGSGTSYTGSIPAQAAGTAVSYYLFTSGSGLTISASSADWYTINYNNNSGSNYSYTVSSSYTTAQAGDWNSTTTWATGSLPAASSSIVLAHAVTCTTAVSNAPTAITVNSGASLTFGSSGTLTTTSLTNNGSVIMTSGRNCLYYKWSNS